MSMEQIKIDSPPWGFCSACLKRINAGADAYEGYAIGNGKAQIWTAYCAHREVGGLLLIRPNRPRRWRLMTPIDVVEWEEFVALRLQMYAGALRKIKEFQSGVDEYKLNH